MKTGDSGSGSCPKENQHIFPKRPEIDLAFRDIRFRTKAWSLRRLRTETKEILHGVSGEFRAGELTAIMGPSGAGKSTLLNVLAAFTEQGSSGEVLINGKPRMANSESWRRLSCYIQQYSQLRSRLTVGEAMTLAAHLKLGYSLDASYKQSQVLELLEILGLSHTYDTLCGKLSGGQKKRLDVALELLSNPSVLFLDEPTTGLDSASTSQCIALLQRLAKDERRTVVCTIHQPSALQFEMFDSLYALAQGHCIYRGPVANLLSHLAALGARCPAYHNPADFLLEVAIGEYGLTLDALTGAIEKSCEQKGTMEPSRKNEPLPALPCSPEQLEAEEEKKVPPAPAGIFVQCYLLYKRQLLSLKRDFTSMLVRLLCHLFIGIIFGYLYMGSGYRAEGILANYVYLYGSLLLIVYTGKMAVTLAFPLELEILTREHFNRWYKLAPYYASLLLIEIPFQAACATTYIVVSYYLTDQPLEAFRFALFLLVSVAASLTAQAWGFFIGATTSIRIAVFIGPIVAVLFSVFGFCIRYLDTPLGYRWLFHVSYFRAGFHSLIMTVYGFGRKDLFCEPDETGVPYCHYSKPYKFLKEMEIINTDILANLSLIVGIGLLMHILTFTALWYKLNKR